MSMNRQRKLKFCRFIYKYVLAFVNIAQSTSTTKKRCATKTQRFLWIIIVKEKTHFST